MKTRERPPCSRGGREAAGGSSLDGRAAGRVFDSAAIERTSVNSLGSIRRVALGVALAGAVLGAAPALAGASPCTYNPNLKQASVVDASGVPAPGRS